MYNTIIVVLGFLAGALLFARFPKLNHDVHSHKSVSVIIPARNEQTNISVLLESLMQSDVAFKEIICVNDASTDDTRRVAESFGVTVIDATDKPDGWTGKSWACAMGAQHATGELLLFIDADVRMSGAGRVLASYGGKPVSVQPYHLTQTHSEQLSFFFNITQLAANGTSFAVKNLHAGLYGPVILIHKTIYEDIGGHASVALSVIDDVALGGRLKESGYEFSLYLGDEDISYRMYTGVRDLARGWIKNFASGAIKTHPAVFAAVFLWITSCTATPAFLVRAVIEGNVLMTSIMSVFYIMWGVHLHFVAKHIGNFKKRVCVIFPVYLAFFLCVFLLSCVKKMFGINVVWKGRKVKPEG